METKLCVVLKLIPGFSLFIFQYIMKFPLFMTKSQYKWQNEDMDSKQRCLWCFAIFYTLDLGHLKWFWKESITIIWKKAQRCWIKKEQTSKNLKSAVSKTHSHNLKLLTHFVSKCYCNIQREKKTSERWNEISEFQNYCK